YNGDLPREQLHILLLGISLRCRVDQKILYGVEFFHQTGGGTGMAPGRAMGRPRAGERRLTRERILHAALELVDREGVAALSMRRLAAALDVDPMAIYHHLDGKEAVIAGLVELAFGELRIPPA